MLALRDAARRPALVVIGNSAIATGRERRGTAPWPLPPAPPVSRRQRTAFRPLDDGATPRSLPNQALLVMTRSAT
jgi:hypothetical protein